MLSPSCVLVSGVKETDLRVRVGFSGVAAGIEVNAEPLESMDVEKSRSLDFFAFFIGFSCAWSSTMLLSPTEDFRFFCAAGAFWELLGAGTASSGAYLSLSPSLLQAGT